MSMTKQDLSSRHFQRKISEFCEVRIAPIVPKRVLQSIRPYLISPIIYRKPPPILNGRIDWMTIGQAVRDRRQFDGRVEEGTPPRPGRDHPMAQSAACSRRGPTECISTVRLYSVARPPGDQRWSDDPHIHGQAIGSAGAGRIRLAPPRSRNARGQTLQLSAG